MKLIRIVTKWLFNLLLAMVIVMPLFGMEEGSGAGGYNEHNGEKKGVERPQDLRCAICLVDYPNTRKRAGLIFTQCNHGFHINCMHRLLATTTKCPCCRREIDVVALVGVEQAQQLERARMARQQGDLALPDVIVRAFAQQMQAGDELGNIYWRLRIAILATNPNIAARRASLVLNADEDDRHLWLRAQDLEDSANLARYLAALPDDASRKALLVRTNNFGMSPLYIAAGADDVAVMDYLLATISDDVMRREIVNFTYDLGSLLQKAAWHGNIAMVLSLIKAGARINVADQEGRTPLHEAALFGREDIALAMLEALHSDIDRQIVVNAVAADGRTPLHEAAFHGRVAMVQLLLRVGADKSLVDEQGMTPADLAHERGNESVAQIIEQ